MLHPNQKENHAACVTPIAQSQRGAYGNGNQSFPTASAVDNEGASGCSSALIRESAAGKDATHDKSYPLTCDRDAMLLAFIESKQGGALSDESSSNMLNIQSLLQHMRTNDIQRANSAYKNYYNGSIVRVDLMPQGCQHLINYIQKIHDLFRGDTDTDLAKKKTLVIGPRIVIEIFAQCNLPCLIFNAKDSASQSQSKKDAQLVLVDREDLPSYLQKQAADYRLGQEVIRVIFAECTPNGASTKLLEKLLTTMGSTAGRGVSFHIISPRSFPEKYLPPKLRHIIEVSPEKSEGKLRNEDKWESREIPMKEAEAAILGFVRGDNDVPDLLGENNENDREREEAHTIMVTSGVARVAVDIIKKKSEVADVVAKAQAQTSIFNFCKMMGALFRENRKRGTADTCDICNQTGYIFGVAESETPMSWDLKCSECIRWKRGGTMVWTPKFSKPRLVSCPHEELDPVIIKEIAAIAGNEGQSTQGQKILALFGPTAYGNKEYTSLLSKASGRKHVHFVDVQTFQYMEKTDLQRITAIFSFQKKDQPQQIEASCVAWLRQNKVVQEPMVLRRFFYEKS